jgi:hypothetical protein
MRGRREGRAGERADEQVHSLSLSRTLVTPTTSALPLAQDNTSRVFPLVFHLAPTHLGWNAQRQIYLSVQGPPGVETPTCTLQLLPPLLLTGGKEADLVIRGNVVLNTLSARSTSKLLRDQICIDSPPCRQVSRPSRTVLRDRLRSLNHETWYEISRFIVHGEEEIK